MWNKMQNPLWSGQDSRSRLLGAISCINHKYFLTFQLQEYFAEKYFEYFDSDKDGTISIDEFEASINTLSQMDELEKLKFLFNLFDADSKYHIAIIVRKSSGTSQLRPPMN